MARRVVDYQIRRIADQGNKEDGPDSRARGDRFHRNRRFTDRGNEKVDHDPGIIYGYPPVYDEYEDEELYYWMTGAGVMYYPTGGRFDVNIYQTVGPNVAKLFAIDPNVKRSSLVLIKKYVEKVTYHNDLFNKSAIQEFVFVNKLPLVTTFSRETAILASDYVFDPGGSFLKLSKLEDEFFSKRGRMMRIRNLEDKLGDLKIIFSYLN